jgi:hypothetical protein
MVKIRAEEGMHDRMRLGKWRICFRGGFSDDSDDGFPAIFVLLSFAESRVARFAHRACNQWSRSFGINHVRGLWLVDLCNKMLGHGLCFCSR